MTKPASTTRLYEQPEMMNYFALCTFLSAKVPFLQRPNRRRLPAAKQIESLGVESAGSAKSDSPQPLHKLAWFPSQVVTSGHMHDLAGAGNEKRTRLAREGAMRNAKSPDAHTVVEEKSLGLPWRTMSQQGKTSDPL